jgi:hypothetical protein
VTSRVPDVLPHHPALSANRTAKRLMPGSLVNGPRRYESGNREPSFTAKTPRNWSNSFRNRRGFCARPGPDDGTPARLSRRLASPTRPPTLPLRLLASWYGGFRWWMALRAGGSARFALSLRLTGRQERRSVSPTVSARSTAARPAQTAGVREKFTAADLALPRHDVSVRRHGTTVALSWKTLGSPARNTGPRRRTRLAAARVQLVPEQASFLRGNVPNGTAPLW